MKENNNITTIAGAISAVCASVLLTGLLKPESPAFVTVSLIGAVAIGLMGYFAKDKNKPNILP